MIKELIYPILCVALISCSNDKSKVHIGPRGIVTNDVFIDDRFGLELIIPDGWEVDDTSWYDSNTIVRLNRDQNNFFVFASESLLPAQSFEDFFDERYQLAKLTNGLISLFGSNSTNDVRQYSININKLEFHFIAYLFKKNGVKEELVMRKYFSQTGRDVISFTTSGENETLKEMVPSIENLNFDLLPPANDSQVVINTLYYKEGVKKTDKDGYYKMYDLGLKVSVPKDYAIEKNLYADGWSTEIKKIKIL